MQDLIPNRLEILAILGTWSNSQILVFESFQKSLWEFELLQRLGSSVRLPTASFTIVNPPTPTHHPCEITKPASQAYEGILPQGNVPLMLSLK